MYTFTHTHARTHTALVSLAVRTLCALNELITIDWPMNECAALISENETHTQKQVSETKVSSSNQLSVSRCRQHQRQRDSTLC